MNLLLLSTQTEKLQYGIISDLYKRPGNFKLDESTAVYLSNSDSAATSGGIMNLRNILRRYHPTTLSKSQM